MAPEVASAKDSIFKTIIEKTRTSAELFEGRRSEPQFRTNRRENCGGIGALKSVGVKEITEIQIGVRA